MKSSRLRFGWLAAALLALGAARPPAVVPSAEAKAHVGAAAEVVGVVSEVHVTGGGNTFIDFGPPYPREDFTAVVFARDRGKFGDLGALRGRTVAATGTIRAFQGRPEIILERPDQLQVRPR